MVRRCAPPIPPARLSKGIRLWISLLWIQIALKRNSSSAFPKVATWPLILGGKRLAPRADGALTPACSRQALRLATWGDMQVTQISFSPPACGSYRQETSGRVSPPLDQGMFQIRC